MSGPNLVEAITAEHRAIDSELTGLENDNSTPEHRRALIEHVIAALVKHCVAEEHHLYPAVRKHVPDGAELAKHEIADHARTEQLMKVIERLPMADVKFEPLVRHLIDMSRSHFDEEEKQILPKLADHCDDSELVELGGKFVKAEKIAPTHPHPRTVHRPPINVVVDGGGGIVDRVRDLVTRRNH